MFFTVAFRSTGLGCSTCCRLNASSWRVSVAARVAVVGGVQQQLDVAGDGREQIVEVVRDAAGELSDRLHLLRLAEPRRQLGTVGYVHHRADAAHGVALLVADHRAVVDDGGIAAVRSTEAVLRFPPSAPLLMNGREHDRAHALQIVRMDSLGPPLLGRVDVLPAEQPPDCIAPVDSMCRDVEVEDHRAHVVDGEMQPLVGEATLGVASLVGGHRGTSGVLEHGIRCPSASACSSWLSVPLVRPHTAP